jgi:hypothetical protein
MNDKLEVLCHDLVTAKAAEDEAKERRTAIEGEIADMLATGPEGTDKAEAGIYKVTVSSKLTRSLDYPAYCAIEADLPEGVRFVDLKPAINLKKLRALEMVDPTIVAQCVTTKPAKASVKVEIKEVA